jgi:hypothetical protein
MLAPLLACELHKIGAGWKASTSFSTPLRHALLSRVRPHGASNGLDRQCIDNQGHATPRLITYEQRMGYDREYDTRIPGSYLVRMDLEQSRSAPASMRALSASPTSTAMNIELTARSRTYIRKLKERSHRKGCASRHLQEHRNSKSFALQEHAYATLKITFRFGRLNTFATVKAT